VNVTCGYRNQVRAGFRADIDHMGLALGIKMGERHA
jgi:hypothetical protein